MIDNFEVMAYNSGFTVWHYNTNDDIEKVLSPNYFVEARSLINQGRGADVVFITVANDVYLRKFCITNCGEVVLQKINM